MSRSKWKGPFINISFSPSNKKIKLKTAPRNSRIVPEYIGQTIKIHNGKSYSELTPTKEMLGHEFGEFVCTRANFSFKKKKSKK